VQAAIIALQDQARNRIRAQIEEGAACIERGDVVDSEEFFEELLREIDGANDSAQPKRDRSNGYSRARKSGRK
jgi:predicted transcriptional regulator